MDRGLVCEVRHMLWAAIGGCRPLPVERWKGAIDADAVFYYRIHGPVILIEFDHQGPIALDGPRNVPTRRHIHTVVRTPNGNDGGKDLLRQHYEAFANDPEHAHLAK